MKRFVEIAKKLKNLALIFLRKRNLEIYPQKSIQLTKSVSIIPLWYVCTKDIDWPEYASQKCKAGIKLLTLISLGVGTKKFQKTHHIMYQKIIVLKIYKISSMVRLMTLNAGFLLE